MSTASSNLEKNKLQRTFEYIIIGLHAANLLIGLFLIITLGLSYFLNMVISLGTVGLAIANIVFSIQAENDTKVYTIVNTVMAVLTFIPFLGTITAIVGIVMSVLSANKLTPLIEKSVKGKVVEAKAEKVEKAEVE